MDLTQSLPKYITEKKNIVQLILFTASFALIFINIYAPFGIKTFLRISQEWELFLLASEITLTGVLVVVISRIIMYQSIKRGKKLTIFNYLIWISFEVFFMALFYTLYESFFLDDARPVLTSFKKSIQNTSLVLLLPYSVSWLYFSWRDKVKQLEEINNSSDTIIHKLMIPFRDEKGTLRISIKPQDLLYFQGSDNYVTIYYNLLNKPSKFLLRTTLKKMETELNNLEIIRCHRSYMVNIKKIKLVRREKDGLILVMDTDPTIEIPVSKTYMQDVLSAFGHVD
ncbi:MAG: LytTR family transcriptional regulator [Marinilabiliaceae bacterium]|nr:LytTR family transcriptional regulator [Marinilabiliaceae bacterium]